MESDIVMGEALCGGEALTRNAAKDSRLLPAVAFFRAPESAGIKD